MKKRYSISKAYDYLVPDDNVSVRDMVQAIEQQAEVDATTLIDWVEGVTVWEKAELEFTCEDFLNLIEINPVLDKMKLAIDGESVNIYLDHGEEAEPEHIVYWHIEEVEEDADVAISIANAIDLYHRNPAKLLEKLGIEILEEND